MNWGWKTILAAILVGASAVAKTLGIDVDLNVEEVTGAAQSLMDFIQQLAVAFGLFGLRDAVRKS